jgi:hypothetical protein
MRWLLATAIVAQGCSGATSVSAPSTSSQTTTTAAGSPAPTPSTGTGTTGTGVMSLDAAKWTEGLVPTYITFRNDAAGALMFEVPGVGKSVNYAYAPSPSRAVAGTLHVTLRIDATGGQPQFLGAPEAGNTCAAPATLRPFIFANNNDWSDPFSRWWAAADFVTLAPGSFTLDIPLAPERWTSVNGIAGSAAPTQFASALQNVSSLGVSFGAGCFYGHGVYVDGGTARWVLTAYEVR